MAKRTREALGEARKAAQPLREVIGAVIGAAVGAVIPIVMGGGNRWTVYGAIIGAFIGAAVSPGWVAVRTFTSQTKRRVDALEARLADRPDNQLADELSNLAAQIADFWAQGPQTRMVVVNANYSTPRDENDTERHARFNLNYDTRLRAAYAELKRAGIATDADRPTFEDAFSQQNVQDKLRDFSNRARG